MLKVHLRQPEFMYNPCESFTKDKERIKKLNKQETLDIIQNEPDKVCLQHDMAYGTYKDLHRRGTSEKVYCKNLLLLRDLFQHRRVKSTNLSLWYQKGRTSKGYMK